MGNAFDEQAYKEGKQSPRTQGQFNGEWVGTLGGVANIYTLTPTVPLVAYTAGMSFLCKFPAATTSASTINISALGTRPCLVNGSATTTNILTASTYLVVFDGTSFNLIA